MLRTRIFQDGVQKECKRMSCIIEIQIRYLFIRYKTPIERGFILYLCEVPVGSVGALYLSDTIIQLETRQKDKDDPFYHRAS